MSWKTTVFGILTATLVLCGCQSTGSPPTKFEQSLFDVRTNYVPVVVTQTNTVWATNVNVQTVYVTNQVGVVVPQYQTNVISVPHFETVTVTNTVPLYYYEQGTNAAQIKQTAAAIGNIVAPGIGGPLAGGIAGLLLAGWGWIRSAKKGAQMAGNFAQVVEAAREVLKRVPDGAAYDAELVNWMQKHQAEAGVLQDVLKLLASKVNNPDAAQIIAKQIADTVAALSKA